MGNIQSSIVDGLLRISGRIIHTEHPICQSVVVDDKVIVLLNVPPGIVENNNVLCFDQNGALIWTIQPSPYGGVDDNPYVFIGVEDDGRLIARDWSGVEFAVSADNGIITVIDFRRF